MRKMTQERIIQEAYGDIADGLTALIFGRHDAAEDHFKDVVETIRDRKFRY